MVARLPWIRQRCAGLAVLNLGCMHAPNTRGSIRRALNLHHTLCGVCARLTGIDIDLSARDLMPPDTPSHDIQEADVCHQNQLAAAVAGRPYDVVVAGELLEHLPNPGLCLQAVAAILPAATLIVTVPNALAWAVARRARRGVEAVHAEHVCWYSPRTILSLLERCGWTRNNIYGAGQVARPPSPMNVRSRMILVESRRA